MNNDTDLTIQMLFGCIEGWTFTEGASDRFRERIEDAIYDFLYDERFFHDAKMEDVQ